MCKLYFLWSVRIWKSYGTTLTWHDNHSTAFLEGTLSQTLYLNLTVLTNTVLKCQLISSGKCNAICNWWWMCLEWNCTPCSSFVITVLYRCHVSRGHDGICFLSTLINFNLLVFWKVQLQPSNIKIYYFATFINGFFMLCIYAD